MSPEVMSQPIFDLPRRQDSVLPYYQPISGTSSVLPRYAPVGVTDSTEAPRPSPLVLVAWAAVTLAVLYMFVGVTKPSR